MEMIEKYAVDFVALAEKGKFDPVYFRETEVKKVIETLCRRVKNNVIIVGPPGVGKTAIVENIAQLIAAKKVPKAIQGMKIYGLRMSALLGGTSYRGEFEEKVEKLFKEIIGRDVILFIDEIHTILSAGSTEGGISFSNLLKPYLSREDIKLIGATTTEEFLTNFPKDKALNRRFHKVEIKEPSEGQCYMILKNLKREYEKFYGIEIHDETILESIMLTKDLKNLYFPDKALELLDLACASYVMELEYGDSDELIVLKYEREIMQNLLTDEYFRKIAPESFTVSDQSTWEQKFLDASNKLNDSQRKFEEHRKTIKLLGIYEKEAKSMKKQGYDCKHDEIIDTQLPALREKILQNEFALDKEFLRKTYVDNYGI